MGNAHTSRNHQNIYGTESKPATPKENKGSLFACSKTRKKSDSTTSNSTITNQTTRRPCEHCGAVQLENFYQNHVSICRANPESVKVTCEYCGKTFSLTAYQTHIDTCEDRATSGVDCEFCKKSIEVGSYLEHIEKCDRNPKNILVPCDYCKKRMPLSIRKKHMRICNYNPQNIRVVCKFCSQTFNKVTHDSHLKECQEKYEQKTKEDNECPICLIEILKTDQITFLACCHKFHSKCIKDWGKKQKICPICRIDFQ